MEEATEVARVAVAMEVERVEEVRVAAREGVMGTVGVGSAAEEEVAARVAQSVVLEAEPLEEHTRSGNLEGAMEVVAMVVALVEAMAAAVTEEEMVVWMVRMAVVKVVAARVGEQVAARVVAEQAGGMVAMAIEVATGVAMEEVGMVAATVVAVAVSWAEERQEASRSEPVIEV